MKILVLNSGSSSQKACLYEIGETVPDHPPIPLWQGKIEWSGATAAILVKNSQGVTYKEELPACSREQVIRHLLRTAREGNVRAIASTLEIDAVGHRVVHGGAHFKNPVVITDKVRAAIESVSAFAPLHISAELEGMKIVEDLLGAVTQVAVFDTAFHSQIPPSAAIYPGPYAGLSAVDSLCTIFFEEWAGMPAFGHSNTRTVQEAPVFSLVRQWHPACVNTTEQRSAAPKLPDGDRRYSRPPRCFCGRLAQLSASAAATFELGRERIATRLATSNLRISESKDYP